MRDVPAAAAAAATEVGYDSDSHCAAVFSIMWPSVNIRDRDFMIPHGPARPGIAMAAISAGMS